MHWYRCPADINKIENFLWPHIFFVLFFFLANLSEHHVELDNEFENLRRYKELEENYL